MKNRLKLLSAVFFGAFTGISHSAVTIDFDPTGEFAGQFSGGSYSESASGGLNSSIGLTLANIAPTTFDGSQSESLAASGFGNGSAFTVGAYINMSNLGTDTGTAGHILRLGLTNGGSDNFASLPFSTIEMTNTTTGEAKFVVRGSLTSDSTITLATNQWYYFETTFTRGANDDLTYDMLLANSDSSGVIGSVVREFSHFQVDGASDEVDASDLDQAIYGSFKGSSTNAAGVLDNFYVSSTGISQVPEPSAAALGLLGMIGLLRRRR